ncbi:MAG: hypothetical protein JNJ45_03520 [Chthonomonas sp.]|nr:hypothetical protein [Chthonomonas sp.]
MTLGRESYFWHKLHSLTGIIPVGFYVAQHLTLNSFAFAGKENYNGVIKFFGSIPEHIMWVLRIGIIFLPLLFHAVYGMFIVARGNPNYSQASYKYRENRYYTLQRLSGLFLVAFLIYHYIDAPIKGLVQGHEAIYYEAWKTKLLSSFGLPLVMYVLGVISAAYHLAYGIWNFCIRWGITISEKSQARMGKVSFGAFVLLSGLGVVSLVGFFIH